MSKNNQKLIDANESTLVEIRKCGLFPCSERNEKLRQCEMYYQSQGALDKHVANQKHKFSGGDAITKAFMLATDEDGVLSSGKFVNRSQAVPRNLNLELINEETINETDKYWYIKGCYNRPKRKRGTRMSEALRNDLKAMFDVGATQASSKISATKALRKLEAMKMEDGRFKYTYNETNSNGKLPSESQIAAFFSSEKIRRSKPAKEDDGSYIKMSIEMLQGILVSRNLPSISCRSSLFSAILFLHDQLDPEKIDEEPADDYTSWSIGKMKGEIGTRQLDISKPKIQLVTLLTLSDALNTER